MTISYQLGPIPKWYFADLAGKPLGSGGMAVFLSTAKSTAAQVFQDPAGQEPWPTVTIGSQANCILFDMNGSQGPFYWLIDPSQPTLTYFIVIVDSNGNEVFTIDGYLPPTGTGGGGTITENIPITNLVVNNTFWRNSGNISNPVPQFQILAPSNHEGFSLSNQANVSPDIIFYKNGGGATDTISFNKFTLGNILGANDPTPVYSFNYTCTATGAETLKWIQFPICSGVQNLAGIPVTITFYGINNANNPNVSLYWYQSFGDGSGATAPISTLIQTQSLTNSWAQYKITTTIPSVSGKTLGVSPIPNDGLFLQFRYTTGVSTNNDIAKPSLYIGNVSPTTDIQTNDYVNSIGSSARTGDVRIGLNNFNSFGWVPMNDGSIGNISSAATTRANSDTFPLYSTLYLNVSDTYAPVSGGRTAPGNTIGSCVTDFLANKPISLTKSLGRALGNIGMPSSGGSGTTWALGQTTGEENHTLTIAEMPSHNHPGTSIPFSNQPASRGGGGADTVTQLNPFNVTIAPQGGGTGHNTMQPITFMNVFIKL